MEAATGFEPMNSGFADRCLTTWLCRQKKWSGKRDLNPRLRPWPRSHSTTELFPLSKKSFFYLFISYLSTVIFSKILYPNSLVPAPVCQQKSHQTEAYLVPFKKPVTSSLMGLEQTPKPQEIVSARPDGHPQRKPQVKHTDRVQLDAEIGIMKQKRNKGRYLKTGLIFPQPGRRNILSLLGNDTPKTTNGKPPFRQSHIRSMPESIRWKQA